MLIPTFSLRTPLYCDVLYMFIKFISITSWRLHAFREVNFKLNVCCLNVCCLFCRRLEEKVQVLIHLPRKGRRRSPALTLVSWWSSLLVKRSMVWQIESSPLNHCKIFFFKLVQFIHQKNLKCNFVSSKQMGAQNLPCDTSKKLQFLCLLTIDLVTLYCYCVNNSSRNLQDWNAGLRVRKKLFFRWTSVIHKCHSFE